MSDYLAADKRCFLDASVRVVGWLKGVGTDEMASFAASFDLRGNLTSAEPDGPYFDDAAAVFLNLSQDSTGIPQELPQAQWAEVSLRRDDSHLHCGWELAGSDPPTQVCFALATANAFQLLAAPASAIAACPPTGQPMLVDVFSVLPAGCFGSAEVTLTGWLGVPYIIGDWDVGWNLEPDWLWRPAIGRNRVLSPDSNALNRLAVPLYFKLGSALAKAPVDRWVNLTGHLSDPAAASCRWVYNAGYDPATGAWGAKPDDASARAACATSFVVDAISNGQP